MTELVFKGKDFVYNHHLAVPFRPLVPHEDKGIGPVALDGNLIIHGDNLHALKSLLPMYAGKIKCIFIDPPYNTGNESWSYNDNVNAPMIKEWLAANPIGIEDGLRHDKWCAMMWPRLRLLKELLRSDGFIAITIDSNEEHRLRLLMDELLGETNFLASIAWEKRYTRSNNAKLFASLKDTVLLYRVSDAVQILREPRTPKSDAIYGNPDNDPRGPWTSASYVNPASREKRRNLVYAIRNPYTGENIEHPTNAWKYEYAEHTRHIDEDLLWWGMEHKNRYPRLKVFLSDSDGLVPVDLWSYSETGTTDEGTNEVKAIFGTAVFDNPKPTRLIERVLRLTTSAEEGDLVLDSFAGSGTTAHAVLEANRRDGGNRQFILVEMEDYADSLTAERVRRVINGYPYTGTQRTELLRERLLWRTIENPERLLEKVQATENLYGQQYDRLTKQIAGGELVVTGEKMVDEYAEGLGGTFTYCTLGEPIELDTLLTGEHLPSWEGLGAALYHMATNRAFDPAAVREEDFYLGAADGQHLWLIYKPDLDWLKSPEAAFTLARARQYAATDPASRHLVFAAARFVSQKLLADHGLPVEFIPLPYALYKIIGG